MRFDSGQKRIKKYIIKNRGKFFHSAPTREEVEKAMTDYLEKGGVIKRIEPDWIEDGEISIY